jgi:hypothetical protein
VAVTLNARAISIEAHPERLQEGQTRADDQGYAEWVPILERKLLADHHPQQESNVSLEPKLHSQY